MRSIELVFDDATDSLVRADWAPLAAAGLPSLAAHTSASNSPHITLAAGPDLIAADEGPWEGLPIDVIFSGAIVFPAGTGRYVLARSVLLISPCWTCTASSTRACPGHCRRPVRGPGHRTSPSPGGSPRINSGLHWTCWPCASKAAAQARGSGTAAPKRSRPWDRPSDQHLSARHQTGRKYPPGQPPKARFPGRSGHPLMGHFGA